MTGHGWRTICTIWPGWQGTAVLLSGITGPRGQSFPTGETLWVSASLDLVAWWLPIFTTSDERASHSIYNTYTRDFKDLPSPGPQPSLLILHKFLPYSMHYCHTKLPWYLSNSFQLWAIKLPIFSPKMLFIKLQTEVPPWHSAVLREVFAHAIRNNAPLCPLTALCWPPLQHTPIPQAPPTVCTFGMKYLHCRLSCAWTSLLLIFSYFITVKITLNEKPTLEAFRPFRRYSH